MSNAKDNDAAQTTTALPQATPVRRRRFSLGWVLPIVGLGVLVYFAYWAYGQKQHNVVLEVADASGIKAFQTPVLCRGVEIGGVTEVVLHPSGVGATIKIRLEKTGLDLATQDSDWWILRPEFSLTDISGVESLLAGPSIEFRPGVGSRGTFFTARSGPPPDAGMSGGLRLFLTTAHRGSIDPGTLVRFRGVPVGRVVSLRLPTDGRAVVLIAEIDRPFAHLIRDNSVFWHRRRAVAAITRVDLGLGGYEIDFPRVNTALEISIDVATPNKPGPPADDDAVFELGQTPPKNLADWDPDLAPPPGTVRGGPPDHDYGEYGASDNPDAKNDEPEKKKPDPIGDFFDFIIPFD